MRKICIYGDAGLSRPGLHLYPQVVPEVTKFTLSLTPGWLMTSLQNFYKVWALPSGQGECGLV
jgi:hypothetical protein